MAGFAGIGTYAQQARARSHFSKDAPVRSFADEKAVGLLMG